MHGGVNSCQEERPHDSEVDEQQLAIGEHRGDPRHHPSIEFQECSPAVLFVLMKHVERKPQVDQKQDRIASSTDQRCDQ